MATFLPCPSPSRTRGQPRARPQSKVTRTTETWVFNANTCHTWHLSRTGSDVIVVPSSFTNYDDTRPRITTTAPPRCRLYSNNSVRDVCTSRHGLTWGGNSVSPKVDLSLGENSASPKLNFSQLPRQQLPANPAEGHSDNYTNPSLYDCMP
jgi:hypothetical protein